MSQMEDIHQSNTGIQAVIEPILLSSTRPGLVINKALAYQARRLKHWLFGLIVNMQCFSF